MYRERSKMQYHFCVYLGNENNKRKYYIPFNFVPRGRALPCLQLVFINFDREGSRMIVILSQASPFVQSINSYQDVKVDQKESPKRGGNSGNKIEYDTRLHEVLFLFPRYVPYSQLLCFPEKKCPLYGERRKWSTYSDPRSSFSLTKRE